MKFSERILGTRGNNFLRFSTMQTKQKFSFLKFTRCYGPHHDTNKACPITVMKWFMTAGRMQTKQKITFLKLIGIALLLPLIVIDCREEATAPTPLVISISAEDVGVTDALIKLRAESGEFGAISFQIRRNGKTIFSITQPPLAQHTTLDTVVLDDSLSPNQSYTYKAYRIIAAAAIDSSPPLTFTTMDTTSHNFTWQIDTLGDGNSSVLRDVAIINDTLAYALGEIYKKDSTGNFETEPYNLAVWNGSVWKLQKAVVYYLSSRVVPPLEGIFAFSSTDIWLTSSYPIHGNGTNWTLYRLPDLGINASVSKIWGTSSSNIYFVGRNGSIVFFNGSSWRKIQSGTELDVYDIWGTKNNTTGETDVFAVAAKQFLTFDNKIFKVTPSRVYTLPNDGIFYSIHGIWFKGNGPYFIVGAGIYKKHNIENKSDWQIPFSMITAYYTYAIRGNDINDIFICGAFGEILHFNGVASKSYKDITGITSGAYYEIDFKNNLIIAVGQESARGVIAMGKR
jgi:hypothetical protein